MESEACSTRPARVWRWCGKLIDEESRPAPARSVPPARRAYGSERRPCPSLLCARAPAEIVARASRLRAKSLPPTGGILVGVAAAPGVGWGHGRPGRCRGRPEPDVSEIPPACGRIYQHPAREARAGAPGANAVPGTLGAAAKFSHPPWAEQRPFGRFTPFLADSLPFWEKRVGECLLAGHLPPMRGELLRLLTSHQPKNPL